MLGGGPKIPKIESGTLPVEICLEPSAGLNLSQMSVRHLCVLCAFVVNSCASGEFASHRSRCGSVSSGLS
jgi:hypothetical protein